MKFFLTLLLSFIYFLPKAQQYPKHIFFNLPDFPVPNDIRHVRKYTNGQVLKIFYLDRAGKRILKAKGRMHVISENEIKMIPFGRKDIVSINVRSILSVSTWGGLEC